MAMREAAQEQDKYVVRLPEGMRDEIKAAAFKANRTMNAEIVARLATGGETLRDRFAMAALTGLIVAGFDKEQSVANAYATADAMLAERQKGGA